MSRTVLNPVIGSVFSPDHRMFSPDRFHPARRHAMAPIEFTGK
jgi:hypothetical protein